MFSQANILGIPIQDIKFKGLQNYILSKVIIIWGVLTVMLANSYLELLPMDVRGIFLVVGFFLVYLLHYRVISGIYLTTYKIYNVIQDKGVVKAYYNLDLDKMNNILYLLNIPYKYEKDDVNSCISMLYYYCSITPSNSEKLLILLDKYSCVAGNIEITISDTTKKYIVNMCEI